MGNYFSNTENPEDKEKKEEKEENKKLNSIINAIKDGDYKKFSNLIDTSPPSSIQNHAEQICVQISNNKKNQREFEQKIVTSGLLESLLFPDLSNELHNAIRAWDVTRVKRLCILGANVNKPYYGVVPLYLTVQMCCSKENRDEQKTAIKILRILIENKKQEKKADVNGRGKNFKDCTNDEEFTAIGKAVDCGMYDIVKYLLEKQALIKNPTILEQIKHNIDKVEHLAVDKNHKLKYEIFQALYKREEDKFIQLMNENNFPVDSNDGWYSFIQLASSKGLLKVVNYLIVKEVDPNLTFGIEYQAVVLAALHGYTEVLQNLLKSSKLNLTVIDMVHDTVIHKIAYLWIKRDKIAENSLECIETLLRTAITAGVDINAKTMYDVTALMVSSSSCNKELCEMFLNYGAFSVLDSDSLSNIEPEFLENFFDSKIKFLNVPNNLLNGASVQRPMLDYDFIKPIVDQGEENLESVTTGEPDEQSPMTRNTNKKVNKMYPEMLPLLTISRSKEHRKLLQHPLIANFLQLKWLKIYHIYVANVLFYFCFTLFFSFYVHNIHSNNYNLHTNDTSNNTYNINDNNSNIMTKNMVWYITFAMWFIIFLREVIQMLTSIIDYILNIENWLEITMLSFSLIILLNLNIYHKYMSAIAIIFTYIELVFLVGRHPNVAKYVTMFTRVSQKTIFMLLCFAPLLFAYAYGFFLMFNIPGTQDFFQNIYSSMFKTLIMAVGEFESGNINFENSPVISEVIFISFILFIAVILINLLNALAISDTQVIIDEAELLCCIAKVNLYTQIESFFYFRSNKMTKNVNKQFSSLYKKLLKNLNINVIPLDQKNNECIFTILVKNEKLSYPNVTGSKIYRFFCVHFLGIDFRSIVNDCLNIKKKLDELKSKDDNDGVVEENSKFGNLSYLGGRCT